MKVEYSEDRKTALFDGVRFRRDAKTGYYLAGKPTYQGKRERLHVYVWRYFNGPIKDGYHIHHKDENKNHNDIENLACVLGNTHTKYHILKYSVNHREELARNLEEHARPKASEWHRSAEGRKWHVQHGIEVARSLQPKEFVCQQCGKVFHRKPQGGIKFCSNKCKSASRRESGVDNETRECVVCGEKYTVNKYSKSRCCSNKCAAVISWDKRHSACRDRAGL